MAEWAGILQWLNHRGLSITEVIKEVIDPAAAVGLLSFAWAC